jgi:hypothetical protein
MELENVGRGDVAEKSAEFDQQGDRAKREDGQVMYFAPAMRARTCVANWRRRFRGSLAQKTASPSFAAFPRISIPIERPSAG